MSAPHPPAPGSSKAPGSSNAPESSPSASGNSGLRTAGIHLLLLAAVGLLVWSTVGGDPRGTASASITGRTAGSAAPASSTPQVPDAEALPSADSSPLPTTFARLAPPTAEITVEAPLEPAAPAAVPLSPPSAPAAVLSGGGGGGEPMLAIPAPGEAWPRTLPPDPAHADAGRLYGLPGATRVVYLIDASGSLIDTFPFVVAELQNALRQLGGDQAYAVMFFAGDRVVEAPPLGLTRATAAAVNTTTRWIDPSSGHVIPSGRPTADAALRRALAYSPDAVVLVSDGMTTPGTLGAPGTPGPAALAQRARLLSLIDTANTADVVFHTAQLRRPDPFASPTRRGTLEMIALMTGGTHRYISEADMLDTP
ncbi:MAG: hypothetical protein AAFX76_06155 [Planctomycetota bacterium]